MQQDRENAMRLPGPVHVLRSFSTWLILGLLAVVTGLRPLAGPHLRVPLRGECGGRSSG